MRIVLTFAASILALAACGGAVETAPENQPAASDIPPASAAFGLHIAAPSATSGFLPLDVCTDGSLSFALPAVPEGVREHCADIGGSHHAQGAGLVVQVGQNRLIATLASDGALDLAGPEGERVYYRTSRPEVISGTYELRTVMDPGTSETGPITIARRFTFEGGVFTFRNVLAREGTEERWATVDHGTYALAGAGEVVLTSDGQPSHVEHVVAFGARGEHLHVGRIGYMTRASAD